MLSTGHTNNAFKTIYNIWELFKRGVRELAHLQDTSLNFTTGNCIVNKRFHQLCLYLLLIAVSVAGSKAASLSWSLGVRPRRKPNLALEEKPWWKKNDDTMTQYSNMCSWLMLIIYNIQTNSAASVYLLEPWSCSVWLLPVGAWEGEDRLSGWEPSLPGSSVWGHAGSRCGEGSSGTSTLPPTWSLYVEFYRAEENKQKVRGGLHLTSTPVWVIHFSLISHW